ncbi:MAG: site-2 protease family protein [Candidatus Omnitrophica bacterium]|nr:site-2 protease family protein [Candidatus Omnitrophota bacterium]
MNNNFVKVCPQCQTQIACGILSCPACNSLIFSQQIKTLAAEAKQCIEEGNSLEGLIRWRKVLEFLPPSSQQYRLVERKVEDLSKKVDTRDLEKAEFKKQKIPPGLLGLGVVGVFLWKFKFLLVMLLTKGKLLLLGLTKAQTFFSMFLTFGIYWTVWGWKFALGLVLSIYVHEMGHVVALKKLGMPLSAPVFIPGVGAYIRLKQTVLTPREDARIGLAGPIAGLVAALFCYSAFYVTGWHSWAAIAKVGAWINLFNLLPFIPLDGGRGFHVLNQKQKWIAVCVVAAMWLATKEGLLILLFLGGIFSALKKPKHTDFDQRALIEYCLLVILLSILSQLPVITP